MEKLRIQPHFVSSPDDLEQGIEWAKRDVVLRRPSGEVVFEAKDVEFPRFWSDTAATICCDKYFRLRDDGTRETGLKQMVERVVVPIQQYGIEHEYFDEVSAKAFAIDLRYLIYNQYFSFNSPAYFNVGVSEMPQVSACFIQGLHDSMQSILQLTMNEGMIFKHGSGSGSNYSELRGENEFLSGGGRASGPVSFMRGHDAFSGVIRSGGKTRRAAKMAILNVGHPDILHFIRCKKMEEDKARALAEAGWDRSFDAANGAYASVAYQNENHSVRMNAAFMRAVRDDMEWKLYAVKDRHFVASHRAKDIWRAIAECAHDCGDPGVQFDDNINLYNTVPNANKIKASNPCSEFLFVDDSACNLASLNLIHFVHLSPDGWFFDTRAFAAAVRIAIIAQEILVGMAGYPTEAIAINSTRFRPLGLGYSNLGGLAMYCGYPYDSSEARALAASISSLMTAVAYATSAEIAAARGPFEMYEQNKIPMHQVIDLHQSSANDICDNLERLNRQVPSIKEIRTAAIKIWAMAKRRGEQYGYRNAQVTLLAPCGTIGPFMDCDTNGAEPEVSLVKSKQLVGGGQFQMANAGVSVALTNLGYTDKQVADITGYINDHGTVDGCRHLQDDHLAIFDCALDTKRGGRYIEPLGHVKMMAAIQPHISGGISKTVNLPENTTVEDIEALFMTAWKMKVKCLTVYRDGSKLSQPLTTKSKKKESARIEKRKMPDERQSICHSFEIAGHEVYLHTGFYPDGQLGEMFLTAAKEGSTMNGFLSCLAIAVSIGLQWGVPLEQYIQKFTRVKFDPSGYTKNREIGLATSIPDYIFRYLARYIGQTPALPTPEVVEQPPAEEHGQIALEAPPCSRCGAMMVRNGSCYACESCGETTGCG